MMNHHLARIAFSSAVSLLGLTACSSSNEEEGVPGFGALQQQMAGKRVGSGQDHWIEMKNMAAEWERTGLIFGYVDDYAECQKAIAGLKQVNDAREYRCTPAN